MKNSYLKGLILSAILLFPAAHTLAQEFHFMPKVGFSLSTLMGLEGTARSGANVGLGVEYLFPDEIFALEGGVYYSTQGAAQKHRYAGEYYTGTLKTDYINVPIFAKLYVYKGLNVFAGPQFGFNVHNSFALEAQKQKYESRNLSEILSPFDFSLCVGAGYQFENGLFFSFNYNFGLTDVLKEDDIEIEGEKAHLEINADGSAVRNGVFQANIGWRF